MGQVTLNHLNLMIHTYLEISLVQPLLKLV